MKIVITKSQESWVDIEHMEIDGKERLSVGGGEPEDAIIGRDLVSCQEIAGLMKEAYNAGINGAPFDIEIKEDKENE